MKRLITACKAGGLQALIFSLLLAVAPGALAAVSLPYTQDFEGFSAGTTPAAMTGWTAGIDDASLVVQTSYVYDGLFPLPDRSRQKWLSVDTDEAPLSLDISMTDGGYRTLYFDAMLYFRPWEALPPNLTDNASVKFAVYLNGAGQMMLFHGGANGNTGTQTVLGSGFQEDTWHRVTVLMDMEAVVDGGETVPFFQVRIDGQTMVSGSEGYATPSAVTGDYSGGSWFRFANYTAQAGARRKVDWFQASGDAGVDNVVFSNVDLLDVTSGPGGPITSSSATHTLLNPAAESVLFTAMADADWITVAPSQRDVAADETAEFTVTINNRLVRDLAPGAYSSFVHFSNTVSHIVVTRKVDLTVVAVSEQTFSIPYYQDFESALAGSGPANFGWRAGDGELSSIQTGAFSYLGSPPLPTRSHTQFLNVRIREEPTLVDFAMNNGQYPEVYADLLVQLTRLPESPTHLESNLDAKFAVFLNADDDLVLFHGGADGDTDTFTVLTATVETGQWVRLTVPMHMAAATDESGPQPFFQIILDGTVCPSAGVEGFSTPSTAVGDYTGGSWFRFANRTVQTVSASHRKLNWISLQGGLNVDDFVVRRDHPIPLLLASSGSVGGPLDPYTTSLTLQNSAGQPVTFTVETDVDWITLPASVEVPAGSSLAVTVSINDLAQLLPLGSYMAYVRFTNTLTGEVIYRRVELTVVVPSPQSFALPYQQDFERVLTGIGAANLGWRVAGDDASAILAQTYVYGAARPIPSGVDNPREQVLEYDSRTTPLYVDFTMQNGQYAGVYADLMVQFVKPPVAPDYLQSNPDLKFALYLNEDEELVLFHGGVDGNTPVLTVLGGANLASGDWGRVTVRQQMNAAADGSGSYPFFQVLIDGLIQTGASTGFTRPSLLPSQYVGGSWFRFAHRDEQSTTHRRLRWIGLRGAGLIDDLVVTATDPIPPIRFVALSNQTGTVGQPLNFTIRAEIPGQSPDLISATLTASALPGDAGITHQGTSGTVREWAFQWTAATYGTHEVLLTAQSSNDAENKIQQGLLLHVGLTEEEEASWSPLVNVTRPGAAPNVVASWNATPGITYGLYASSDPPGGTMDWWLVDEITADEALETYTTPSSDARTYYQVAPIGTTPNDTNPWGVINASIVQGVNFLGVPLAIADRTLNGELGALLASGLESGSVNPGDGDKLYVWHNDGYWQELWLDGNKAWQTADSSPLPVLSPGRAFFIERNNGAPAQISFIAPLGNDNQSTIVIKQGWNPLALSEGRRLTAQSAFTNLDSGTPQGSGNPRLADRILERQADGSWIILIRETDGDWRMGTQDGNSYLLQPGRAYYYQRRGATDMEVRF